MKEKSSTKKQNLDPESVKRRTELFLSEIMPHKGMVYDIAIKLTSERKDIEDNYRDALIAMYRYIDSYNPRRDIKSWIYAVTTRLIFNANIRNSRVVINRNIEVERLPRNKGTDNISFRCLDLENYREHYSDAILEALDKLPEHLREVLLLQQAGYKVSEIVEITYNNGSLANPNAETVKSRLHLAKRAMKQMITCNGEKRYRNE